MHTLRTQKFTGVKRPFDHYGFAVGHGNGVVRCLNSLCGSHYWRALLRLLQWTIDDLYVVGGNTGEAWLSGVDIFTVRTHFLISPWHSTDLCQFCYWSIAVWPLRILFNLYCAHDSQVTVCDIRTFDAVFGGAFWSRKETGPAALNDLYNWMLSCALG